MSGGRNRSKQWVWVAALWGAFGLFDGTQTVGAMRSEGMHHAWLTLFAVTAGSWLAWALATPLIIELGRRFPVRGRAAFAPLLVHVAACACVGLAFAMWSAWLEIAFNPYAYPGPPPTFLHLASDKFYNGILSSIVLYAVVIAIAYAVDYRERLATQQTEAAQLNERLSQAQLSALRHQIEPHFLFNALNSISGLVREGRADAAVAMIAALSDFLRRTLEDSNRQEVPLEEEMAFVMRYLDIQKARFGDRLQLRIDVPAELYAISVPNLILQPLVENAVKHGISKRARGGSIEIDASRAEGKVTLRVGNDGPSLTAGAGSSGAGIGLANVRARLESLYGDGFELRMQNREGGGVEVSVSVPLREPAAVA
jgi:hypothetical protein